MENQNKEQQASQPDSLNTPPQTTIQPRPGGQETLPPYPESKGPIDLRPKRKKRKALIILLVLLLLAAGGWYAYQRFFAKKSDAPTSQNKEIDQINVGLANADLGTLYPEIKANSYSYMTNSQMFEGLVGYENKSKIAPLLGTDWTNPDSSTWVFNLKSGVTFHNGNTMNAEDVKYSIDKIKASGSDYAEVFAGTIESVKVVNDQQVEIKTTEPDPTLLNRLAFLYIIDNDTAKITEPGQAGTGPYVVKSGTTPNNENIQMVAYDNYHGGKPKTRAVSFNTEKDIDALIQAYREGKYNIAEIPVGKTEGVPYTAQFVTNEPEIFYLGLNTVKSGPLQKKEVREAIRYAVDPAALGKAMGDRVTPLSQLIPESIPGYNPAIPAYQRNVAKAKELLASAGYADGLTIRLSNSSSKEFTDELANQLKEANITLQVDFHENFDEFLDYFIGGNAEMYSIIYSSDFLDGLDMYQTTLPPEYYSNPELDSILSQAGETVDPAKRLKLLQDAAVIIDKDVAAVPLFTQDTLWLMDKDYEMVQDMPSSFLSVYFYKVQLK